LCCDQEKKDDFFVALDKNLQLGANHLGMRSGKKG